MEETQSIKSIRGEAGLSVSLEVFLLDALKAIKENEVKLSFGGPMRPVLTSQAIIPPIVILYHQ
ncbi:hypothetical protein [Peribacillus sp. FSL R5-0717]|uniref:hypothetical protein n=1 Tax=Peribacillus sp. FSL R5-0717 TaxID=2975308 RepID=UPI0030F53A52